MTNWFVRNAANVNRQTSVKTSPLFSFSLCVFVWASGFVYKRKIERNPCFCVFLLQCSCLCVCACWMVKDQHCMINTHWPTLCTLGWTEQSVTLFFCFFLASVWPHCQRSQLRDVVLIFWGVKEWDRCFSFVDFKIFWDIEIWFLLFWADMEWFEIDFGLELLWSWMGSKLDEIRL